MSDANPLGPYADLDGETLEDLDLSGVRAPDARLVDCEVTGCVLDDAHLDGLRLVDVTFTDTRASVIAATGSAWRDSAWRGGRLGALDASESSLTRVDIADCKIDMLNLGGTELRDVTLTRVQVGELFLGQATGTASDSSTAPSASSTCTTPASTGWTCRPRQ